MSGDDSFCEVRIGGPITEEQYKAILKALDENEEGQLKEAIQAGYTLEFMNMYWTYDSWMDIVEALKKAKVSFDVYRQHDMDGNDSQHDCFRISDDVIDYDETWYETADGTTIIDAEDVKKSFTLLKEKFRAGELHEGDFDSEIRKVTFDPPALPPVSLIEK